MFRHALQYVLLVTLFAWVGVANGQNSAGTASQVTYSESLSYSPRELPPEIKDKKKRKAEQTTKPANLVSDPKLTISVGVYANDPSAKSVLNPSDFKVFVDEKEAEILSVENRAEPLNVILLIDTSPSTDSQFKNLKALALRMVEKLGADDRVAVFGFNIELKNYTKLTSDRAEIAKGIERLKMGDGTSIYGAITKLSEKELTQIQGQTGLVIMTDGADTTSTNASYESSLIAVEKLNTVVFPVYFDTYEVFKKESPINLEREYAIGRTYLNDLILLSGGRPVKGVELVSGKADSLDNLLAEIKGRYRVTFRLPPATKSGERHRIKVRVNRPNLTVLAKGSYIDQ